MDESYVGQLLLVIGNAITWSNFFKLVGVIVCGLFLLVFILVFIEWLIGVANSYSYVMWQRRTLIHRGIWKTIKKRWLLPWMVFRESFHFWGYRNLGRETYKSTHTGGYWRGIGDHATYQLAHPPRVKTTEDEA